MAMEMIRVERMLPRKKSRMKAAKSPPTIPEKITLLTAWRMNRELSLRGLMFSLG